MKTKRRSNRTEDAQIVVVQSNSAAMVAVAASVARTNAAVDALRQHPTPGEVVAAQYGKAAGAMARKNMR
jgi:hypothetical protein